MEDIFVNNLEKYNDPEKYDEMYQAYQEDLNYIIEYARKVNGPIIELACGTGRITIPLAKIGINIVGVDIHEGMLQLARNKANQEKLNIHFERQDCSKLSLPMTSSFIFMTGNSFQHFLTNESQDDLFQSVKKHLQPKGEFLFDTRNPMLAELAVGEETEERFINRNQQTVIEKHYEEYLHETQILYCTTKTEIWNHSQHIKTIKDSINLRYTFPMELKRILDTHGFELIHLNGSWRKDPFTPDSISMIVHCKLK